MIDIHSHILPGLDDGPGSMEESVEMLRMAAANGTTDIVATPHASPRFPYDAAAVRKTYAMLSDRAKGIINVHLGCDLHLTYDSLTRVLSAPDTFTTNGRCYLMVELPDFVPFHPMREALLQMIRRRITPIITHPERNASLQANKRELERWIKDGCLIQVTGQSFFGHFGSAAKKTADILLKSRLVHFVASDAHDVTTRPPDLSAAYTYVRSRQGVANADSLFFANPTAVLWGEALPS